jgi:hypothetical protein
MIWQPITSTQLEEIVARQLQSCTPSQQEAFSRFRVPLYKVPIQADEESVFVLAHLPFGLLYYEDIEEGFEVATLGVDGTLPRRDCNQYDLCHVLTRAGL